MVDMKHEENMTENGTGTVIEIGIEIGGVQGWYKLNTLFIFPLDEYKRIKTINIKMIFQGQNLLKEEDEGKEIKEETGVVNQNPVAAEAGVEITEEGVAAVIEIENGIGNAVKETEKGLTSNISYECN